MSAEEERLGQLFRRLRCLARLTQEEIAIAASIPVRDIRNLEIGAADKVLFGRVRRLFAEVDARPKLSVWWHGAAADRLLDGRHADIAERAARLMAQRKWEPVIELSFRSSASADLSTSSPRTTS
ncbi:MAG: hypothetical protein ABIP53_12375 [Candidatus Limnocylindrales bacterium]